MHGRRARPSHPGRRAGVRGRRGRRRDADRGLLRGAGELLLPGRRARAPGATAMDEPAGLTVDVRAVRAGRELRYGEIVVTARAAVPADELETPGHARAARVLGVEHAGEAAGGRVPIHGGHMSERLIVIGGGGAGTAAATIAKRLNPDLHVTLFTEFPDIAYSPCGIPFVHGREIQDFESLFLSTVERYIEDGLDMRMETTVTDLDLDRGTVTAKNTHEGFDKLVIGTGFTWEKPDVPGSNLEGPALRQGHPRGDAVRRGARGHEARRGLRRHAARRRDGRQPRPSRAAGRLRRRGPVGAVGGARPGRRRAGPRVAREARRDDAARHQGRGLRRPRRARRRGGHERRRARVRRGDRLPAQAAQQRARRGRRASRPARPAASSSTSGCAPRTTACGRRAT